MPPTGCPSRRTPPRSSALNLSSGSGVVSSSSSSGSGVVSASSSSGSSIESASSRLDLSCCERCVSGDSFVCDVRILVFCRLSLIPSGFPSSWKLGSIYLSSLDLYYSVFTTDINYVIFTD